MKVFELILEAVIEAKFMNGYRNEHYVEPQSVFILWPGVLIYTQSDTWIRFIRTFLAIYVSRYPVNILSWLQSNRIRSCKVGEENSSW